MSITTKLAGGVAVLWVGLVIGMVFAVGGETPSVTLKRTQSYAKLVGGVQSAQDKLNTFLDKEKAACEVRNENLQLSPQGMLTCVAVPKPPVTPNQPAQGGQSGK